MTRKIIDLSSQKPIATGKTRIVYQHPASADTLIKLHRTVELDDNMSAFKKWFLTKEDYFVYMTGYLRELSEYIRPRYKGVNGLIDERNAKQEAILDYIAPLGGFVDTSMGIGFLVTAVRDAAGNLAPTLGHLIREGQLTPERIEKLHDFLSAIKNSEMVLGDLNFENAVLGSNADGSEQFYLIDGLGERTFITIQVLFKYARKQRKQDFIDRVLRRLERKGLSIAKL